MSTPKPILSLVPAPRVMVIRDAPPPETAATGKQKNPPEPRQSLLVAGSERIIRPNAAMEMLGISKATLYRLVKSGMLPPPRRISIRVTGWLESELLAYLKDARAPTPPPQQ